MGFLKSKKFYLIFALLILMGYGLVKLFSSNKLNIPEAFNLSRMQTALISEDIINLSNQIKTGVSKVNELEEKKDYKEAFNTISEINLKILNVRAKAFELSKELQTMTLELNNIQARGAEKFALASITNRVTIINHLINYTDYLSQLNSALEKRFYGKENKDEILSLINKINAEVDAINEANEKAKADIQKFDEALK
jgi:hypothetical protein